MRKLSIRLPNELLCVASIALLLCVVIGRKVLFSPGIVLLAENFEVYSLDALRANYTPYWQDKFQYFDFGIADSVYLYGSSAALARLLGLSYSILQRLLLILPHAIAFLTMYGLVRYLLRNLPEKPSGRLVTFVSFISGVVYTFNPWIAVQPRDVALRWDYSLTPLILMLFFLIFEQRQNRLRNIVCFSMAFSFIACFRYALIMVPVFALYFLTPKGHGENGHSWRDRTYSILLIIVLGSLLSLGKFLSPILYAVKSGHIPYAESFHEGMIGGASVLGVFSTKVLSSEARRALDETYTDSTYQMFLFISILSFLYLVLIRRRPTKHDLFFPVLTVLMMPLATLKGGAHGKLMVWLLTEAPLSDLYGRLLRHADWNSMPIVIAFSVMWGLTTYEISDRIKGSWGARVCAPLLLTTTVCLCVISSWPLVTGDMNGYWRPSQIPREFVEVNDSLSREDDDFHVLWLPSYWEHKAEWAANVGPHEHSAPTCNFAIRSSSKPSYLMERFYPFDYYNLLGRRAGSRPLDGYDGNNIVKIYKDFNVRYVVVHNDVEWDASSSPSDSDSAKITDVLNRLRHSGRIDTLVENGCLTKVKISGESCEIRATTPICVLGGLPVHGALHDAGVCVDEASLVYLEDQSLSWQELKALIGVSPVLIVKGETNINESLVAAAMDESEVYLPYEYTKANNPMKGWSRCYVHNGVSHPYFQEALKALDLGNWSWDFDYGKGLAYTVAPNAELDIPVEIPEIGTYALFMRCFVNEEGGAFICSMDGTDFPVSTKSGRNCLTWEFLAYMNLSEGKSVLKLKNLYGFNAVNLIGLMRAHEAERRYEELREIMGSKARVYICEAETDCENSGAEVCREGDASNGYLVRFDGPGTSRATIDIQRDGAYTLQLRMKGRVRVALDDEGPVDLQADDLQFLGASFDTLSEGKHELAITPLEYPSSVDVLWVRPAERQSDLADLLSVEGNGVRLGDIRRTSSHITMTAKAFRPFLLAFSKGYDPLIRARVNGKKIDSIRIFGLMNGFLIEEPGEMSIDIELAPQSWQNAAMPASLITALLLVICVVYLRIRECVRRSPLKSEPEKATRK